jgi:NADPH:quinone reductase-like Zn-dependent oxidoreductase
MAASPVRRTELLGALSLAIDLGTDQPQTWVIQSCLAGLRFAQSLGLTQQERREVFDLSLLRHLGCTAAASRVAALFGSEMNLHRSFTPDSKDTLRAMQSLGGETLVDGPDLPERVAALTGGALVKLALDAVAGEATMRLSQCLAEGGVLVSYGAQSQQPCVVPAPMFTMKNIQHRGLFMGRWFSESGPEKIGATFGTLAGLIGQGVLKSEVEATYPLTEVRAALAHAMRERDGRILITPN